jgi:hypothetical protein
MRKPATPPPRWARCPTSCSKPKIQNKNDPPITNHPRVAAFIRTGMTKKINAVILSLGNKVANPTSRAQTAPEAPTRSPLEVEENV